MGRIFVLCLGLLPLLAGADISGAYRMQDGKTMTLHYRDDGHLRMDMADGGFMLVRGDKAWMVRREDGQWTAMDLSSMGRMMQQMGFQPEQRPAQSSTEAGEYRFRDTGRTETVAGYQGKVYETRGPKGERSEVVLSTHEDIRKLTRGWMTFSGKMVSSMGVATGERLEALMERERFEELGGALRVDDGMRLQSVSTKQRPDGFFSLPEGTRVQDLSAMGGAMPQQGGAGSAAGGDHGGAETGDAAEFMNERKRKAGEQTRGELEREADERVKKGVNKLMDGLFGG